APSPSTMKISEKVPTNTALRPSTRGSTRPPSSRGSVPETVARYPGTSGRQQGDRNDTSPAANASAMFGASTIQRIPPDVPVELGLRRVRPDVREDQPPAPVVEHGGRKRPPAAEDPGDAAVRIGEVGVWHRMAPQEVA